MVDSFSVTEDVSISINVWQKHPSHVNILNDVIVQTTVEKALAQLFLWHIPASKLCRLSECTNMCSTETT